MWLRHYISVLTLVVSHMIANKTVVSYSEIEDDAQPMVMSETKLKCCSGVTYEIDSNANHECCGTQLLDRTTDRTSQICCNGTVRNSKPNFQCCGTEYFNPNEGMCCPAYYLGFNKSVDFPPEIANDEEAKKNAKCCGVRIYDSRNQICCEKERDVFQLFALFPITADTRGIIFSSTTFDRRLSDAVLATSDLGGSYFRGVRKTPIYRIREKKFSNTICCNGDALNGDVQTNCKAKKVPRKFFNRSESQKVVRGSGYDKDNTAIAAFCLGTKFDLVSQVCCTVEIKYGNKSTDELISKIHPKTKSTTACCGIETYDFDTEICCNNEVHKQNNEGSLGCCDGEVYDDSEEDCLIRRPYRKPDFKPRFNESCTLSTSDDVCCGNQAYNISDISVICCRSFTPTPYELKTLLHTNVDSANWAIFCCGTNIFNPNNETCCGTNVYPRVTHPNTCCGSAAYNPEIQICCNDTVFDVNPNEHDCCGFSLYSRDSQFCCSGKVYAFAENEERLNCCQGKQLYDHNKQICCNSALDYSTGVAKKHWCCPVVE